MIKTYIHTHDDNAPESLLPAILVYGITKGKCVNTVFFDVSGTFWNGSTSTPKP